MATVPIKETRKSLMMNLMAVKYKEILEFNYYGLENKNIEQKSLLKSNIK